MTPRNSERGWRSWLRKAEACFQNDELAYTIDALKAGMKVAGHQPEAILCLGAKLAGVYLDKNLSWAAVQTFKPVLDMAKENGFLREAIGIHLQVGLAYRSLQNPYQAHIHFSEALAMARNQDVPDFIAAAERNQAVSEKDRSSSPALPFYAEIQGKSPEELKSVHNKLTQSDLSQVEAIEPSKAEEAYAESLAIAHFLDDPAMVWSSLRHLATHHHLNLRSDLARTFYKDAYDLARQLPQKPELVVQSSLDLAHFLLKQNEIDSVEGFISLAASFLEEVTQAEKKLLQVLVTLARADLAKTKNQLEEATHHYHRVDSLCEALKEGALPELAEEYQWLARDNLSTLARLKYDTSFLYEFIPKARAAGRTKSLVLYLSALGDILTFERKLEEALSVLQEAYELAVENEFNILRVQCLGGLAVLMFHFGNFEQAREYNRFALRENRALQDSGLITNEADEQPLIKKECSLLMNMAQLEVFGFCRTKEGLEYYREAEVLIERHGFFEESRHDFFILANLVDGDYQPVIKLLEAQLKTLPTRDNMYGNHYSALRGVYLNQLARACALDGQISRAGTCLQESSACDPDSSPLAVSDREGARGFVALLDGNMPEAIAHLNLSTEANERAAAAMQSDSLALPFQDMHHEDVNLMIWALVAERRYHEALLFTEKNRSRSLVNILKNRRRDAEPTVADFVALARRLDAVLVFYHLAFDPRGILLPGGIGGLQPELEKSLFIWVITPSQGPDFIRVDIEGWRDQLDETIKSFAPPTSRMTYEGFKKVQNPKTDPYVALYRKLVAPLEDYLDEKRHVVFIPHGYLSLVPFAALKDAQGRRLIEKVTPRVSPSLKILALTGESRHRPPAKSWQALIAGNPLMPYSRNVFDPQRLNTLEGAEEECAEIAGIFDTEPLKGERATKKNILPAMGEADLIHLATHGLNEIYGNSPYPGALAFAPENDDDGYLNSGEIASLRLQARLAVLSACDSGRGHIRGEGVVGLARSFLAAGVDGVVVTLWPAVDKTTSTLMAHFYREMLDHEETHPADALRHAMLRFLDDQPGKSHPHFWAPFIFVGN